MASGADSAPEATSATGVTAAAAPPATTSPASEVGGPASQADGPGAGAYDTEVWVQGSPMVRGIQGGPGAVPASVVCGYGAGA